MGHKATTVAWTLSSHNLPYDRARELFKPSEEAESLLASILKNPGTFGFEFFGVTSWLEDFGMMSSGLKTKRSSGDVLVFSLKIN